MEHPRESVEWLGFDLSNGSLRNTEKAVLELQQLLEDVRETEQLGKTMSLIGKINFMARVDLIVRPLASVLMSAIPFDIRNQRALHA